MIGLGVILAVSTSFALRMTKCRNKAVGALIGTLVGLVAVAASHYFAYTAAAFGHIGMVGGQGGVPLTFSEYITKRVDTGWSVGRFHSGIPISGFFVWAVWVIEGIAILVISLGGGIAGADAPFCEKCGCHANKKAGQFTVSGVAAAAVDRIKEADSVRLMLVESGGGVSTSKLKYTVTRCPSCDGLTTLEIKHEWLDTEGKESKEKSDTLHEGLLLSSGEAKVDRKSVV